MSGLYYCFSDKDKLHRIISISNNGPCLAPLRESDAVLRGEVHRSLGQEGGAPGDVSSLNVLILFSISAVRDSYCNNTTAEGDKDIVSSSVHL